MLPQHDPLRRQAVEVGRVHQRIAEAPEVAVSQVVGKDEHVVDQLVSATRDTAGEHRMGGI